MSSTRWICRRCGCTEPGQWITPTLCDACQTQAEAKMLRLGDSLEILLYYWADVSEAGQFRVRALLEDAWRNMTPAQRRALRADLDQIKGIDPGVAQAKAVFESIIPAYA